MEELEDIRKLGYLCSNNPWRWKGNIENIINKSSKEDFFQIYNEICFAYSIYLNAGEEIFQKYFEEIFEKRIIDPEIEVKTFGENGRGIADFFVRERKKIHNQTMDDIKKIYCLWKLVGIQRKFNVSFYPDDLNELFEQKEVLAPISTNKI